MLCGDIRNNATVPSGRQRETSVEEGFSSPKREKKVATYGLTPKIYILGGDFLQTDDSRLPLVKEDVVSKDNTANAATFAKRIFHF